MQEPSHSSKLGPMGFVDPVLRYLPWLVFAQGLFLAVAVLSRWKHPGNRYLGSFILFLSLHGLVALAWQAPGSLLVPEISVIFSGLPFLYGPLIYRYIWHSLYRDWTSGRPFTVHVVPALANFLIYGTLYLVIGRESFAEIAERVYLGRGPVYVEIIEYLKIIQGVVYAFVIIRLLVKHKDALGKWTSKEHRKHWLGWLTGTFAFNWVLVVVSAVLLWRGGIPRVWGLALTVLQLVSFLFFLYIISFFSLRYPVVLDPQEVREAIRKKLNLSQDFVDETLKRLDKAEKNRFYTDPDITLPSLAATLGLHANALSYIVNDRHGIGFREYLNGLRLDYFLELASSTPDSEKSPTNLEMAFSAGFASKTTFLRAFRTRFGTTPADFLAAAGTNVHTEGTGTHTGTPGTV